MPGIIGALADLGTPFSILTKSTMVLRDIELLAEASRRTEVRVNLSIGTLDERAWRTTEPGTPPPLQRVETVRRLNEAGIECGVLIAPVLPGISDAPEQLEAVVGACVDAGAVSISSILLHLRPGVRELFLPWLQRERPDLVAAYDALYAHPSGYAPRETRRAHAGRITALAGSSRVHEYTRMPAKYSEE